MTSHSKPAALSEATAAKPAAAKPTAGKVTTTMAPASDATAMEVQPADLTIVLRRERGGPEIAREPVLPSDVADVDAQLWLDGWLRAGRPDVPYEALSFQITARLAEGAGSTVDKLVFEASDAEGRARSMRPTTHAFQSVATRASQALLAAKILRPDDLYFYEVALRHASPPAESGDSGLHFTVTARSTPLAHLTVPIGPLVERAETVGEIDDRVTPVFYTADALLRAQRYARKGADDRPPTETGAVLVGPLCSCPETGELFVVICEALEARDAEGSSLSLEYTGKTWARIQRVVRAKQSQPGMHAHRIVGQAHGHNVLPGPSCAECEKAQECKLTSVFVSHDDHTWSQAVFARQPWHVCHIFGLSARGEHVHALFSLRENRLEQRAFYVISDFDPPREPVAEGRSQ